MTAGKIALTLAVILGLLGGGYALYLNHLVDSNVRRGDFLPDDADRPGQGVGDARNILLLGSDSRSNELRDGARADVIQLVHIPDNRESVQVIHIPRDLYVEIPGRSKNKVNAAYAFGGAPLLVQTLENLLDVRIDHVAAIGFDGFKAMTNTVGGVDVNVEQASSDANYQFRPGTMHMDGDMALAFVRERKQLRQGDLDRGKRQQAWIHALLNKAISTGTLTNPTKLAAMISDVATNLVVDNSFTTSQMRGLAWSLRNLTGDSVSFLTTPVQRFDTVPGIGSVDIVDTAKTQELSRALRTDDMSAVQGQISDPG